MGCQDWTGIISGWDMSSMSSPAPGRAQSSSTSKYTYTGMWDWLPPVSIISCMDDTSVPINQGSLLYHALRRAKLANIINPDKNHHRVYAKKSHTSLIVEDPLLGDFTLVFDVHRIISRTNKTNRRDSRCLGGHGHELCFPKSHIDLVLVGFNTSSTVDKLDIDEALTEKQDVVIHHYRYGEEEEDVVIRRAKENLSGTVHPYLVSIARKINPF